MILNLFRKFRPTDAVYAVYSDIVAQSRQPRFYIEWGVPDTVTGRFDMISIHLALLLRRLRHEDKAAREFSQALTELFFKDMDRSLREMGVGDLTVPKKIKKMGNIFYGLMTSLDAALSQADEAAIAAVLARNVLPEAAGASAMPLAQYVTGAAASLVTRPTAELLAGPQPQPLSA